MTTSQSTHRLFAFPSRRPWLTLGATLVCLMLSLWQVSRVRLDSSLETMLNRDDASTAALSSVMKDFSAADDLLVMASLPDSGDPQNPGLGVARLQSFVARFGEALRNDAQATALCEHVVDRIDPQYEQFVEHEMAPAGLYYLNRAEFDELRLRLTPEGIRAQIAQDETMITAPGPGSALAKVLLKDPLRLREFLIARVAAMRPGLKLYPGVQELISADGRHALVLIHGRKPPGELAFSRQITEMAQRLAVGANGDALRLSLAGSYAIASTSERAIRRDMILNILSSVVAIQVLFWFAYRGPWAFPLTMAPTAIGILVGFGLFAFFWPTLSPLTGAIGGILAGLGVDYSIFYLAIYGRQRLLAPDAPGAAGRTGALVGLALLSGCGTSIAGFASIALSNVPGLHDFATLGTLGLAGSLVAAMVLLPAVLRLLESCPLWLARRKVLAERGPVGPTRLGASDDAPAGRSSLPSGTLKDEPPVPLGCDVPASPTPRLSWAPVLRLIDRRSILLIRLSWLIFALILMALATALLAKPGAWFESDITVMHPRPNPALEAQEFIARAFGFPPTTLLITLNAETPEALQALAVRVDAEVKQVGGVTKEAGWTLGPGTFLPDPSIGVERSFLIRDFDIERALSDLHAALEESIFDPAVADDYARLLRRLFDAKTSPPGIGDLIRYPALSANLLPKSSFAVGAPPPTSALMLINLHDPLRERGSRDHAINAIRTAIQGEPGATLTGLTVVAHDTEAALRRDLWKFLGVSGGVIVLWVVLLFRRAGPALLALLPVTFGLAVMLTYVAYAGDRLNLVSLLGVPLLLGCGVDYGIFLVSLAEAGKGGNAPTGEVRADLEATCQAIFLANLTSVLGFGGLITSSTPALQSLGRTVGVGMLACLAATLLFLLPILLRRSGKSEA